MNMHMIKIEPNRREVAKVLIYQLICKPPKLKHNKGSQDQKEEDENTEPNAKIKNAQL